MGFVNSREAWSSEMSSLKVKWGVGSDHTGLPSAVTCLTVSDSFTSLPGPTRTRQIRLFSRRPPRSLPQLGSALCQAHGRKGRMYRLVTGFVGYLMQKQEVRSPAPLPVELD